MYEQSKATQKKLWKALVAQTLVSVIFLAALLAVTMLAVELSKETNTSSDGRMTVAGQDP
eukprot:gene36798-4431_t